MIAIVTSNGTYDSHKSYESADRPLRRSRFLVDIADAGTF